MKFTSFFARFILLLGVAAPEIIHAAGTTTLALGKSANLTNAPVGAAVQFNIGMTNIGITTVSGLIGSDIMPSGFQITGWTSSIVGQSSQPVYNPTNGQFTVATMAPGNSALLTIFTTAATAGTYTNIAVYKSPVTNAASVVVTVTPNASGPVSLVCQSNITVAANGPNGASSVFYSSVASGGCSTPTITFNPPSGSIFPIGTNIVTCTASDTCGSQASCAFTVTVTPPPLTLICSPNLTIAATNSTGTVVIYYNTIIDGCGGANVVSTPPSGSMFPIGQTVVNCTATDAYGQQASGSFTVTVTPPSPPVQTTITTFNYDTNAGLLHLQWTSALGKVYTIQESLDLNSWQDFLEGIPAGGSLTSNQSQVDPTVPANFFRIREDVPVGPFASDPILAVGEGGIMGADGGEFQPSLPFIQSVQQYYISQLIPTPAQNTTRTIISNNVSDQVLANALFIDYLAATNPITSVTPEAITAKNDALRWYYLVNMKPSPLLPGTNGPWARGIDPSVATNLEASGIPVFVATESTNARQSYTNGCALKGVPIPPDMYTGSWMNLGQILDPFISTNLYAELWIYVSQNPPGVCLALPRYIIPKGAAAPPANASIELLGLVCMGFKAQADGTCYACFWDNPAANRPGPSNAPPAGGFWKRGVARPLADFISGTNLNAPGQVGPGGQCSDCHSGQNSFVVHPAKAAFKAAYAAAADPAIKAHGANLNGEAWYKPFGVDSSWPQNPNPGNDQGGDCANCHKSGDKAGRLPLIYDGVPGYCEDVLTTATMTKFLGGVVVAGGAPPNPTMPPKKPGKPDYADMKALYEECMKPLPTNVSAAPNPFPAAPAVVSAPSVIGPLYASATRVAVKGAILGATVTLYTNGVAASTIGNARSPTQVEFTIPALATGVTVTASQTVNGASNVSAPQVVLNYFTNSPGNLPAPFLDELTLYQGANMIEAIHDPGVTITILRNGVQVAQIPTSSSVTIIPLTNGPPFQVGDVFQAYETLAGVSSSNSDSVTAISDPVSLPAPTLDTLQTYPGQELLMIDGLVNGAQASVFVNGVMVGQFSTPESSMGEFDLANSGLGRPLQAGDQVTLSQTLAGMNSSAPPTNPPPTAATCGSLPAPSILTPVAGVTFVEITQSIPGSQVYVFDGSGAELGTGSGSTINLSRSVVCGDILTVSQRVGACASATGYRITVVP